MLTRDGALPAEIYAQIFSSLDFHDLVQLLHTCRTLFNVTVHCVWRVVELEHLVTLLPGSCMVVDSGIQSEPDTPAFLMTSDDYYARFMLYAPYVEVLKTEWSDLCIPSKYFMDRRTYTSLRRVELPNLKEVDMGYTWSSSGWPSGDIYGKPSLFWLALLIPPTLESLSFTATEQRDLSLLGTLLARCAQLTRFIFRPDQRPNWDTWLSIPAFRVPQEITSLEISCDGVGSAGYSWLSKLTKLRSLELSLCQSFGQLPQPSLRSRSNHSLVTGPHAFSALRNLCISITHENQLPQIIEIWRTIAAHVTHVTIKAPGRLWGPGTFSKLFVGLTSHCLKLSFLHVRESRSQNYGANVLPTPISHISALQSLPLQTLRISCPLSLIDNSDPLEYVATIFPDLEELWLEKTPIMIDELLTATVHFPHIRHLQLGFHYLKPTDKLLSDTWEHAGSCVDNIHAPESTLTLILGLSVVRGHGVDHWWSYGAEDWDFAARLLTPHWSSISINTANGTQSLDRFYKIKDRFAFYSKQRATEQRLRERG